MPLLRPCSSSGGVLRASRCIVHNNGLQSGSRACKAIMTRTAALASSSSSSSFSSSSKAAAAAHDAHGAHGDHYDPPGGWLWGVRPGEKYQKEGWEGIWVWGFFGSLGLGVVAYAFKPDTSIQTWALEEARRRLEAEGILKEPDSKS